LVGFSKATSAASSNDDAGTGLVTGHTRRSAVFTDS
jgi:hypothetical protein